MTDTTRRVGVLSILAFFATISMAFSFTRVIRVDCALCKERLYTLSLVEYHTGPWKDIPSLHILCLDQIANELAPNSNMTISEWLEIRGFKPRTEEQKRAFEKLEKKSSRKP